MIDRSNLLIITLLALLISCNEISTNKGAQKLPQSSRTVVLKLIDSLGTVSLSIPLRYDTSFSWTKYSDCGKPCEEQKYRFQPKLCSITKESGWLWVRQPKDPIERLTVSHTRYFPFHDGDTAKDLIRHSHLKSQLASIPNPPIIFDTIEKINDRYYSIFCMQKSDTLQSKKVLAVTTIKGNLIRFEYELLTRKDDSITNNFVRNSIGLIQTISLSNGR